MIDKIVTQYPIYKLLSHRKAKLYNLADFLIINDTNSAKVVKDYFNIEPDCIIHEAIDTTFFLFSKDTKRDSVVLHYPSEMGESNFKKIIKILNVINPKTVYILGKRPTEIQFSNIPMQTSFESNYTNERLKNIYSKAMFSIVIENKGSFELIPIESIASGVPVIGYKSPSIYILETVLKDNNIDNLPFIELTEASGFDNRNSFNFLQENITEISDIVRQEFSREKFALKVLKCVEEKT